jgi:hypothetical protein
MRAAPAEGASVVDIFDGGVVILYGRQFLEFAALCHTRRRRFLGPVLDLVAVGHDGPSRASVTPRAAAGRTSRAAPLPLNVPIAIVFDAGSGDERSASPASSLGVRCSTDTPAAVNARASTHRRGWAFDQVALRIGARLSCRSPPGTPANG